MFDVYFVVDFSGRYSHVVSVHLSEDAAAQAVAELHDAGIHAEYYHAGEDEILEMLDVRERGDAY